MNAFDDFLKKLKSKGKHGEDGEQQIREKVGNVFEEAIAYQKEARKPRAWGYSRVSHRDSVETGVSLDYQEIAIRKYVAFLQETTRPDLVWGNIFVDKAVSAYTTDLIDRPAGRKLNDSLKRGDLVVIYHIDRGFRNTRDMLVTIDNLWTPMGVNFAFVEPTINTSSPYGRYMLITYVAAAELESGVKSIKNKGVIARQKERGYAYGQPKWGWKNVGPKGAKRRVPNEKVRDVGRLVLYLRDIEEKTFGEIARAAAELESVFNGKRPDYTNWNDYRARHYYVNAKKTGLVPTDTRKKETA